MKNPLAGLFSPKALTEGEMTAIQMGDILPGRATHVTQANALTSAAVLACLIVRAETFAALPAHVYTKKNGRRDELPDDPVAAILGGYPNPFMTSADLWRWKQLAEDLTGDAFIRVVWRGRTVTQAWPMTGPKPRFMVSDGGEVSYEYTGDVLTPAGTYPAREVLHFRGPIVQDQFYGTSLVQLAADSIGIAIDSERFFSRFLTNGSHFPGYLQTDTKLQPEDIEVLRAQFDKKKGVEKAGDVRIFDRGLKWITNAMSLRDADLTSQQRWNLEQVCRVFRVPLAMVQDMTHGTYTNSEQQDLWFAKHTLTPIAVNTEKVIGRLFADNGQRDQYIKFELDGLLRGDYKTRAEGTAILVRCGVMTRNEGRLVDDRNPIEGLDKPLMEVNTVQIGPDGKPEPAAGTAPTDAAPTPAAPEPAPDPAPAAALAHVLADAQARVQARRSSDGDTPRTLEFIEAVMAPVREAYRLAGLEMPEDNNA